MYPGLQRTLQFNLKLAQRRITCRDQGHPAQRARITSNLIFGIITPPHTRFLAETIKKRLITHGWLVDIFEQAPQTFHYDYYFILCPQIFKNLPPGEKRICFQLEQSVSSRWFNEEYFNILESSLAVLDYSLVNIEFLKTKGISYPHVYYVPIGSEKITDQDSESEKTIEVLFYGDSYSSPRRTKMLEVLHENFSVEVINDTFGEAMHDLIKRSKVVINIHYYENALLETPRIMESLSLGATIVSESSQDLKDYEYLTDCIYFFSENDVEDMIRKVQEALNNHDKMGLNKAIRVSSDRFNFMFDRALVGLNILSPDAITDITTDIPKDTQYICLSMPETIDRRRTFEKYQPKNCYIFDGIRRKPGWIGAALSYRLLAKNRLASNTGQVCIMEDDVLLPDNFESIFDIVLDYIAKQKNNWDVFAGLIASLDPKTEVLAVEEYRGIMFVTINKMTSMVCNIYNKNFLETLVKWDSSNTDVDTNTIDRYIENQPSLKIITTLPFIVGHREELQSSLWGFENTQYVDMISKVETELLQKILEFKTRKKAANKKHERLK